MDLISNTTMEVTKLALDGLMERQRAVGSNIANVMTPGYQRKEIAFESQLSEILEKDKLQDYIKRTNSANLSKPVTKNTFTPQISEEIKKLTIQEANFLESNIYENYKPQVLDDIFSSGTSNGNNVELEQEMMDLNKTGTKYLLLSNLARKQLSGLAEVIRGGTQ